MGKLGAKMPSLRAVAPLYKVFLFNYTSLAQGQAAGKARTLQCMNELLERGKDVAVVHSTPRRASTLQASVRRLGVPESVSAWSSGEFIYRALSSTANADGSPLHDVRKGIELKGAEGRPLKVFELSALATPKRWTDRASRSTPVLSPLETIGSLERVDEIEKADFCYWDATEDDEVKEILDAVFELCLEFRVPLLHAANAQAVLTALGKECMRPNSAEAHACSFMRLGGKAYGVGKLDGLLQNLQGGVVPADIPPREALLISSDLGDVIESAAHGLDSMLVFEEGSQLPSQLSALGAAAELERQIARRKMSVSQRVQDDSPAMMHAASAPFLSFLQLPTLIAKATQRNAEQKGAPATPLQHATSSPQKLHEVTSAGRAEALQQEEMWDAVLAFCKAKGIQAPIGGMPHLRWDETDMQTTTVVPKTTGEAGTKPARQANGRAKEELGRTASESPTDRGRKQVPISSATEEWRFPPHAESVGDILGKLQTEKA